MEKKSTIQLLLSMMLLMAAFAYWTLETPVLYGSKEMPEAYKSIYSVTGNDREALDILKCSDLKTVQCALDNSCSAEMDDKDFKQECFNDWVDKELYALEDTK